MILALLTLGVGYLVFAAAAKEADRSLRLFGLAIEVVIIIGSAATVVCKAGCATGICPSQKMMCPIKHHHAPASK